jgi:hypothetical protein
MLQRKVRENLAPAVRLLEKFNIKWEVRRGGKHIKLTYYVNDKAHFHFFSCSASDYRAALNDYSDIRRNLRKLGVNT